MFRENSFTFLLTNRNDVDRVELIDKLNAVLALLSVGENCTCERCQAARMLAKVIEEIENERKLV